uniref:Photosynthesis system II assembly factor Ycf48/Hcf136-like domain-containing protein n=1 Tax=Candidatus Kentrum sp. SD TaxID=2126332 RepID=A0A451BJG7_9GAMM|nr:MAG: Uncharacterized protein BECKSD772D_GA0070982_101529 [Candidatus Kentron sp. SD]
MLVSGHAPAREAFRIPDNPAHAWSSPLATQSLLLAIEKSHGRTIAVGERGHILTYRKKKDSGEPARVPGIRPLSSSAQSADMFQRGGGEWPQAKVPTRVLLTGVSLSGAGHGWTVGHDATILATSDGGETWRKVHEAIDEERPLLDIHFWDDNTGIAVGAYGYLLRTEDGGASWRSGSVHPEHDFHLNAIAMAPAVGGPIYIVAESGYVYRSDDGGTQWRTRKPPYDGSLFGVYPLADDRVMVFGLRGHLFVSEDRGENWRAVETGTRATLTSAIGLDSGQFLLTGHAGTLLLLDADLRRVRRARLPERRALADAVEMAPGWVVLVGEGGIRTVELSGIFPMYRKKIPRD